MGNVKSLVTGALAGAIETSANAVLALDTETAASLRELDGHVVALQLAGPEIRLYLYINGDGIQVLERYDGEPAACLRASPAALLTSGAAPADTAAGRVHIEGDAHIAQRIQQLLKRLRPDWEEPLAKIFGDVIGPQIAHSLRAGFNGSVAAGTTLAEQISEYLREESDHLVGRMEMQAFIDEVDAVRDAVDRLEARLNGAESGRL